MRDENDRLARAGPQLQQFVIIEGIAWQRCQIIGVDAHEFGARPSIKLLRDGEVDEAVPQLARTCIHTAIVPGNEAAHLDAQHQPGEAAVSHQQVAATAEHEKFHAALPRPAQRLDHVLLGPGDRKVPRRAPDAEGGQGCQRLVFVDREK